MSEYEKTQELISYLEDVIESLREQMAECDSEESRFDIAEAIHDYTVRIGELNGYLNELAGIDGYHSYEDMISDRTYEEV